MTFANTQTKATSDYLVSNLWFYRVCLFAFNNSAIALGTGRSGELFSYQRFLIPQESRTHLPSAHLSTEYITNRGNGYNNAVNPGKLFFYQLS